MKSTKNPNVLITGTPGTGKTTTAQIVAERTGLSYINVGELVIEHNCHEGKDEEYDTYILDDDKLIDVMDPMISNGGYVIDFHSCEIFPERWFELVLVLRADTTVLFDRLSSRGYSKTKLDENMEAEIMQVVMDSARESYDENIVHELSSNTMDDLESNVDRVVRWLDQWR
eukprot:CAMPEP_0182429310 /NCGR_PEP_ID=MMETSP1167-20130531/25676_1 /TAXON_ID=2988 /ORGANISM="Mallomonas Sp, Strain CCMP3275" /LENGTH=170 /DNA_ID=CAMNT_0024612753 /DNA_START=49 /DNA_END=557 /DNA_ORIENTATION=+